MFGGAPHLDVSVQEAGSRHEMVVDLTNDSDNELFTVNRPSAIAKNQIHQSNGPLPAGSMVDLTAEEDQDFPYLRSGTLGSPMPRPLPTAFRHAFDFNARRASTASYAAKSPLPSTEAPITRQQSAHASPIKSLFTEQFTQSTAGGPPLLKRAQLKTGLEDTSQLAVEQLSPTRSWGNVQQSQTEDGLLPCPNPAEISCIRSDNSGTDVHQSQDEPLRVPSDIFVPPVQRDKSTSLDESVHPTIVPSLDIHLHETESLHSDEIPLSLEAFQDALHKLLREARTDHQYYVKSRLSNARERHSACLATQAYRGTKAHGALKLRQPKMSIIQHTSPFIDLKRTNGDQTVGGRSAHSVGKLCQFVPRTTKQGSEVTTILYTRYSAGNLTIPPYTNYISTKRNILIEDDKNRTFLPYYGDDASIDRDYAQLESRISRNRIKYHHSNDMDEKVKLIGPYVEDFLAKVGCDVPTVLRYLLDETNPVVPRDLSPEFYKIWLDRRTHLVEGYYDGGDDSDGTKPSNRHKPRRPKKKWQNLFNSLAKTSSSRQSAASGLACAAFSNLAGFSLWHVVKRHRVVMDAVATKTRFLAHARRSMSTLNGVTSAAIDVRLMSCTCDYVDTTRAVYSTPGPPTISEIKKNWISGSMKDSDPLGSYADLGCLVCYAHECPGHGEFDDEDEEKNIRVRINAKRTSSASPRGRGPTNQPCPVHAKVPQAALMNAMGLNNDKTISGQKWCSLKNGDCGFKDDELCSASCFWLKSHRSNFLSNWSKADLDLFTALLPAHITNNRGSCLMALVIEKSCSEIFSKVLQAAISNPSSGVKAHSHTLSKGSRPVLRKNFEYWLENSITWEHHERPPFKPCNHLGPCNTHSNCHCHEQEVTCEKTCMCPNDCPRRYRGCTCGARGKVCWQNDRCDCYRLNRECDPDLCQSCGAREVLDPVSRYRSDKFHGKCANVFVQRGVPRRTLLGHSQLLASGGVSGWGLYMGEPTRKGDYIGEYVGEVISKEESEQRGIIYNKRNLSYLFDLNSTQTLDSTLVGNKFRYINHQAPPHANCQAKTLFCNTVHRIGMFACRNIEVGEEILFDYGEGFAAKFDLIKLDDQDQPIIQKRRKDIVRLKEPEKPPRLSKNGKRIGRPRKNVPSEGQGIKEAPVVIQTARKGSKRVVDGAPSRTLKRKRSPEVVNVDDAEEDVEDFEDVLPSEDAVEDQSSSESFHESDYEEGKEINGLRAKRKAHEVSENRRWRTKLKPLRRRGGRLRDRERFNLARIPKDVPVAVAETSQKRDWTTQYTKTGPRRESRDPAPGRHQTPQPDIYEFGSPQSPGWVAGYAATDNTNGDGGQGSPGEGDSTSIAVQNVPSGDTPQKRGSKTRYTNIQKTSPRGVFKHR